MINSEQQIFDPRIKLDEESGKKPVVWCAQSVEWAKEAVYRGQPLSRSPFFEGDPFRRRGNIVYEYSDYELSEWSKCAEDFYYFLQYCKIKIGDGTYGNFSLRDYQYQQIEDLLDNKYCIFGWSRQSGKTVGLSLYILWKILFNRNYGAAILANKSATSGEVLTKIKNIFVNLPFFLQGGVLGWNGGTIYLDNESKVFTGPTTLDALNGKTCTLLYIDEFAFCYTGKNKIAKQKEFLANALPVISSQAEGQCVISSTPNGKEYFYEIFDNSMKGLNDWKGSIVKWFQIPERTIEWAKREIRTITLDKFKVQYEVSFDVTSESLLSSRTMKRLALSKRYFGNDVYEDILSNYNQFLYFDPDIDIDFENDFFILSVDIAEGLKKDYSVIQILRLEYSTKTGEFYYRQVGMFRSNEIGVEDLADVACEIFMVLNQDNTRILVEQNTYGDLFFAKLKLNDWADIPYESILKFKRSADTDKKFSGLRINGTTRDIAVKSFKSMMDTNKLIVTESQTLQEIENFQKNAKGKYSASIGHDDTVTPLTNFSYFIQLADNQLTNWLEDYAEFFGIILDANELSIAAKTQALLDDDVPTDLSKFDKRTLEILGL